MSSDTISGSIYLQALAGYIKAHEIGLANFNNKTQSNSISWTTLLTLGAISTTTTKKPPLLLQFDPHHLYYLLLKFDELGIAGIGQLDITIQGGATLPLTTQTARTIRDNSDSISLRSTMSSFSIGSSWWSSTPAIPIDETTNVKYLYSSCTKIPAISLSPYNFNSNYKVNLQKPVKDFLDCPPPLTAVPLYAFKNLQSLVLEDLDPRAFLGWDILNFNLKSLVVKRSGIEDLGELLCDTILEDLAIKNGGKGVVGQKRRFRARNGNDSIGEGVAEDTEDGFYPKLPTHSWSSLIHLSIASNSLTFIPSAPLLYLTSLTSLDLSSNLLISIPVGLNNLVSLKLLNLSDNMIDSLTGVAKALPNIQVINLANNRIDNLSGLDKLLNLERLDLRENRIIESLEISRLSRLPLLKELYLTGNPFTRIELPAGEANYRIKCFNYFYKEGNTQIKLDGSQPGLTEKSAIVKPVIPSRNSNYAGPSSRVGGAASLGRAQEARSAQQATLDTTLTAITPSETIIKAKKKKSKRIVDLDLPTQPKVFENSESLSPPTTSDEKKSSEENRGEIDSNSEGTSAINLPVPLSPPTTSMSINRSTSSSFRNSSSSRPQPRRQLSGHTFQPPSITPPFSATDTFSPTVNSTEEYRRKMEALREEIGPNWLTVLASERESREESIKSAEEAIPVVRVVSKRKKKSTN